MIESSGKTFLDWLILRYQRGFQAHINSKMVRLIICTSTEDENKSLEKVASAHGIEIFFGSPKNVPLRFLNCANQFGLSHIIPIDGDDILCSVSASLKIYDQLLSDPGLDIVSSTGLPLGMNSSGLRVDYLKHCLARNEERKLETGWGRIFENPNKKEIAVGPYSIYDKLRFTLDYPEDAHFFKTIIEALGPRVIEIQDQDLIDKVIEMKWDQINTHLFETYWDNYNNEKLKEENENERR